MAFSPVHWLWVMARQFRLGGPNQPLTQVHSNGRFRTRPLGIGRSVNGSNVPLVGRHRPSYHAGNDNGLAVAHNERLG